MMCAGGSGGEDYCVGIWGRGVGEQHFFAGGNVRGVRGFVLGEFGEDSCAGNRVGRERISTRVGDLGWRGGRGRRVFVLGEGNLEKYYLCWVGRGRRECVVKRCVNFGAI